MKILVIDGQGGGVGKALVEKVNSRIKNADIIVVGTNSTATVNMMKGAAVSGATGENAVVYNCKSADVIVGPIGIIMANAMLGEITPKMAEAVSSSGAHIFLVPMNQCHAQVVGVQEKKLTEYLEEIADGIAKLQM